MRDKLLLLRNHGLTNRNTWEIFGYNSRLDSLQAIIGNHLIRDIHLITDSRIRNAQRYDESFSKLSRDIIIPKRRENTKQVFHTYVMLCRNRDKLLEFLISRGIEAKVHYPVPLHLQPACSKLGYKLGDFPVCESHAKSILTLPVHQHLTSEQIQYTIDNIFEFYETKGG